MRVKESYGVPTISTTTVLITIFVGMLQLKNLLLINIRPICLMRPADMPTINPVTALITILPDTIIISSMNITRNFGHRHWDAGLLVKLVEGNNRFLRRKSRNQSMLKSTKAILSTRPFSERKLACFGEIWCFADIPAVLGIVQPLIWVLVAASLSMDIADTDVCVWIHRKFWGATLVGAQ